MKIICVLETMKLIFLQNINNNNNKNRAKKSCVVYLEMIIFILITD